ncbi:MAG: dihydrofolate reductase family protein [Tabrizicola sp.]|uniref:dihydrofolate reductase family protein n=1 Tax=Tabrizicola sp. TaxID=2005166 RepID=UPI002ABAD20C|nr:dihydrofolate reductase family protein [Tabrizicola sp.]MDZ4089336.1 dihydrofolate reductase family protein [Tabrizicola sp.]
MSRCVVRCFSISIDGFGAGPEQSLQDPLGKGGMALHGWVFKTRTFQAMHGGGGGGDGGEVGGEVGGESIDESFAAKGFDNLGAWILGRNMFGPVRGPWPDYDWQGWWGEVPPYHCPVFVLTNHARPDLRLADTTFHFVTEGLEDALARAKSAAGGKDVRLGGGVATLRDGFRGSHIDEAHFAISPVLLGRGEAVFADLDLPALGYAVTRRVAGEGAEHIVIGRS